MAEENNDDNILQANDDFELTWIHKIKLFLTTYWRGVCCLIAPLLLIPILTPFPGEKYQWCAYTLMLMAIYWVAECIPLPITSFLPIVIFPLADVMDTLTTCACYMNDTILMFLGSMILAAAVEQSGLHKRMALCAIRAIGYSHYRLLFALCFMTMFISMWITNTAATTMMVPINFALLKVFEEQQLLTMFEKNVDGDLVSSDITTCYYCAATFSATIGGIGTLVGTATNLVFKGLFSRSYPLAPEYLSFPKFSAFTIPYMLAMEIAMYTYMLVHYFGFLRPKSGAAKSAKIPPEGIEAAKKKVDEDWNKLGLITFWEIMVIILFSGAMLMFFCRSPKMFVGWGDEIRSYFGLKQEKFVLDSAAAMLISFLMLLLPSNLDAFKNFNKKIAIDDLPKSSVISVLNWTELNRSLPYSFMFLLGGGFALSQAAKPEYSDLNGKIGEFLRNMKDLPNCVIILLIIIFTVFVTNFASNVAVCNVIAPIVMQLINIFFIFELLRHGAIAYSIAGHTGLLAKEIDRNPLWYNIAAGLSASYCFCLPVGTPGNLVVQGAANIPTGKMIKAGFGPTITTILISWLALYFWAPVIWPDLLILPDWVYNKE